ncbi:DUF4139 domain-containing protein [Limnoglobus roseus]|uniref:DUF4139 domain-containing protein n=1 Tax=Limnoglobus roseus TaxID=2598579 RepID=A0A5C1A7L6_9BACT|nr:DUF4139 domain-containing protein [Limnoglobus roseus]QEL14465.1 hypothetical protein PX52LOC_01353 [Limnoglobus roseus]
MTRLPLAALVLFAAIGPTRAEPAAALGALAKIPVKEVTVFKDGHAYVVHQGTMPVDAAGNVLLDLLPNPVLGTFWPYSANPAVAPQSVTAGRRRVTVEQTALTLRELIEANPGAEVVVTEGSKPPYPATIVKALSRPTEEVEKSAPVPGGESLPQKGNVLLLKTIEGTKAVSIDAITDVKFVGKYETKLSQEEYRNLLTMKLDWAGQPAAKSAEVGMAYVQKGIRWIPNYRVELDGKGKATVKMQATLINELTDLKDATVNLVIGVPSFYFKDSADPIALNQALTQLSSYFEADGTRTQFALSNSMMTQNIGAPQMAGSGGRAANPGPNLGPDLGGNQSEDLFVFTLTNVTLAKGQRMVLAVSQQSVDYKDVYTLDVPYAPPLELRRQVNDAHTAELVKMMAVPKVQHKVRLTNGNAQPFTTAPALILKDGKVLSQAMMTYTSKQNTVDLTLTTAIDVRVKKKDKETKRTPNAQTYDGHAYWRIDIGSSLELTNNGPKAVEVEVTRSVLGNLDKAADGVKAEMVNLLEDDDDTSISARPGWWGSYSWPVWWGHFNGVGRITWTAKLEPGQSNEKAYSWYYYWR